MSSSAECKHQAGTFIPKIDRNRCEGKADCAAVCPVSVFRIDVLPATYRRNLSLIGKFKGYAHGWQQALLDRPDACEGCGLCVQACPERAITLVRVAAQR